MSYLTQERFVIKLVTSEIAFTTKAKLLKKFFKLGPE